MKIPILIQISNLNFLRDVGRINFAFVHATYLFIYAIIQLLSSGILYWNTAKATFKI